MTQQPARIILTINIVVLITLLLIPTTAATEISGVAIFPADNIWNTPVDQLPVDQHSAAYVQHIGSTASLHPDFGSGLYDGHPIGIPFNIVDNSIPKQTVDFDYAGESDPGPYPIPADPLIEGGAASTGDRHILILQKDEKKLYELYAAEKQSDGTWHAGSGAVFDLSGDALRPAGWTSADAAGLAILPGLVRYDEVAAGKITHAIRFTAQKTQRAYVWPARHYASTITDKTYPPMGQRFRLKALFDTSGYPEQARVILEDLKKYGIILSDNGGNWFITGQQDDRWDNDALNTLKKVKGSDFEAVDSSPLMISSDSGEARVTGTATGIVIKTVTGTDATTPAMPGQATSHPASQQTKSPVDGFIVTFGLAMAIVLYGSVRTRS